MNSALHLLGIARKAGRLEIGEEPVGAAARARQAKLILVAADAADNSARRAAHFAEGGKAPWAQVPFSKGELGGAVGRASCAMLAVTDAGLASALVSKLAAEDPQRYGALAGELEGRAARALQRQKEQRAHEKKLQRGQRKPWAPPPKKAAPPAAGGRKGNGGQAARAVPKAGPAGKRPLPRGIAAIHIKKKEAP